MHGSVWPLGKEGAASSVSPETTVAERGRNCIKSDKSCKTVSNATNERLIQPKTLRIHQPWQGKILYDRTSQERAPARFFAYPFSSTHTFAQVRDVFRTVGIASSWIQGEMQRPLPQRKSNLEGMEVGRETFLPQRERFALSSSILAFGNSSTIMYLLVRLNLREINQFCVFLFSQPGACRIVHDRIWMKID